jgi:hypothetical protein
MATRGLRLRGWVYPLTMETYCRRCFPAEADVLVHIGQERAEVGVDEVHQQEAVRFDFVCANCGRHLAADGAEERAEDRSERRLQGHNG